MNALLDNTADLVLKLLNKEGQHIVNGRSLHSPRAVGDAVQEFLGERNGLQQCIPSDMLQSFESEFERRSMEDMAFYRCAWMGQIQIINANVLKFEKNKKHRCYNSVIFSPHSMMRKYRKLEKENNGLQI